MSRETYIERLQRENGELADALIALDEFHAALDRHANTAYKYDAMKAVEQKKEVFKIARAKVDEIIKKRKEG